MGFGNGEKKRRKHGTSSGPAAQRPMCNRASMAEAALSLGFPRGFGALEADLGVGPVTERLVHGAAATAKRDYLFPADIKLVAIGVNNLKLAQVSAHHVR